MIATRIDRSAASPTDAGAAAGDVQRRLLPKDRPLQLLERRTRLDPELVDEGSARILVRVQGLRLPARPVQRRHQIPPQTFAERVLGDECLELADQLVVAPEREVGVDPELDRCQPDLLEPGDRRLGEALVGEVRERRAPPQRQRVAQPLRRVGRQAAGEQAPPLVHQPLESVEIELVGLDPDDVAGRSGRQHVLRKRLAKSRDVDPQRGGGALGRVLAPELVDQPVSGNDLVGVEEEHGEKRTRLAARPGKPRRLRPTPRAVPGSGTPSASPPGRDANSCCSSETDLKHDLRGESSDTTTTTALRRTRMKKLALPLSLLALGALGLVACGGDDDDAATAASETEATRDRTPCGDSSSVAARPAGQGRRG